MFSFDNAGLPQHFNNLFFSDCSSTKYQAGFASLQKYHLLTFPTWVFPNPKPGFFSYFLLPETRVFFNHQTRILKKTGIAVAVKY